MAEQTEDNKRQKAPIKGVMSLEDIRNAEEEGYDAPFATFTWKHWMETQAHVHQCFSRFVRAAENQRLDQMLMIGLEVQEIGGKMLLEAYAMSTDLLRESLPGN